MGQVLLAGCGEPLLESLGVVSFGAQERGVVVGETGQALHLRAAAGELVDQCTLFVHAMRWVDEEQSGEAAR